MGSSRRQRASAWAERSTGLALAALSAVTLALLLGLPPRALADEASSVIERCAKGQSLAGFSEPALAKALRQLSTVLQEYSNCEELIRRAELASAGGGPAARSAAAAGGPAGGSYGGEAPLTPTAAEQPALAAARRSGASRQDLGGRAITPGVVHVDLGSALSALPDSLLAALAALAALALAGGARLVLAAATAFRSGGRAHLRAGRRSDPPKDQESRR